MVPSEFLQKKKQSAQFSGTLVEAALLAQEVCQVSRPLRGSAPLQLHRAQGWRVWELPGREPPCTAGLCHQEPVAPTDSSSSSHTTVGHVTSPELLGTAKDSVSSAEGWGSEPALTLPQSPSSGESGPVLGSSKDFSHCLAA